MALSEMNSVAIFKFLNGETNFNDFENFIYHTPHIENELGSEIYLNLIAFNFNDKNSLAQVRNFILENIIPIGLFETWKLKTLLTSFINEIPWMNDHLNTLYHLYCGTYQENGTRIYEYKFLANLGLNYFFWMEEGYLRIKHGDNWEEEWQRLHEDFDYYHKQLKPFAEQILKALDNKEIVIMNDGTYTITDELKEDLESNEIYKLDRLD